MSSFGLKCEICCCYGNVAIAVALLPAVGGFCVSECVWACTAALMLPPCCVLLFSRQNSVSTNPWKLRRSEPAAKPFPTEPRPRVCTVLCSWLVPPVAGLPSLLGVGPSPSLGGSALPNRLLPTVITSAEPRTHQHTIKVWPASPRTCTQGLDTGLCAGEAQVHQHGTCSGPGCPPALWTWPCVLWLETGEGVGSCPPAVEVMCLFGLGCSSEKLWEVTISVLSSPNYQRIYPAEKQAFDMWPLQTTNTMEAVSCRNSPRWCCVAKVGQICSYDLAYNFTKHLSITFSERTVDGTLHMGATRWNPVTGEKPKAWC